MNCVVLEMASNQRFKFFLPKKRKIQHNVEIYDKLVSSLYGGDFT